MGAKVADKKCFTFANDNHTRTFLNKHYNYLKIPCLNNFRDLGAHINFTKTNNGATLSQRIKKAAIRQPPWPAGLGGCQSPNKKKRKS